MKSKKLIFAFVFFVLGFLITFSFQQTRSNTDIVQLNENEWERDYFYRKQLIELEDTNKQLRTELIEIREKIQDIEQNLASEADELHDLVETKTKLQKLVGELAVHGSGVEITLSDSSYIPSDQHANQYIVHDRHIHQVINELYSAGAKAIAINDQRIYRDSYITCVGPVITVDGSTYAAPFVISAIGDPDLLDVSLNMKNGVIDMLVQENVKVGFERKSQIEMEAREL
ncbi:Uncharacterized conserved protein YlxW, UPF0749 family [Gracilibacillus ureilyticus]|uniref:Uncharacterized conserved protein YlxW, UPF0749 family n=1 Tax=Gracilibacillus ureilyticus TaxID=531814 RepID=A0A1H9KXV8_9BACI|nr:DUF881 domain-containing protein [Gracilibacillus ureilyticus]SER04000.1 Uncharacterized conserved protein YlxW, UPF0749 family [Gracilibacillus ureilyticus]